MVVAFDYCDRNIDAFIKKILKPNVGMIEAVNLAGPQKNYRHKAVLRGASSGARGFLAGV